MAPKKVAPRSSSKKVASKKEQKKQVAPLTKETGVPTATTFGEKKSKPAAPAGSAGAQAGSSTSASLGSVTPPGQVRSKKSTMSAAEAVTLLLDSPATSDVGSSQESSTQSTQVVTHLTSVQQPQPQQQLQVQQVVVQAQVHAQGDIQGDVQVEVQEGEVLVEPQGEVSEEAHGAAHGAVQVPTMLVPPEVGAHQEIDIEAGVSREEGEATPPDDSFSPRSPARKRSRRVPRSSSSSPAQSDDMDKNWEPSTASEGEEHREQTKVAKLKRKAPEKLKVMEPDLRHEVLHSDVDEQDDNNDVVITSVIPASPAMQQTDIYTLSRRHAERDPGDVALVAPPTQPSRTSSTTPTAPIFSRKRGPPPSAIPSSRVAAISAQPTTFTQGTSSTTSSGIGSIPYCGKSRPFQSPVWDFFTVSDKHENIAICSICKARVSRGKLGSNYGTGGQRGHLERTHGVEWYAHLAKIKETQSASVQNVSVLDAGSDDDEEEEASDISSVTPRTPGSSTPSATHRSHTESLGATPMRKSSTPSQSGTKKSFVSPAPSSSKKGVQRTITSMFASEAPFERNHPLVRLYNTQLATMLALDLLPFSFVEGVGFLKLVATLSPKWKVPSRFYFSRVAVPALHKEVVDAIGAALQKSAVHTIHLTTDMWTSCQALDYMCITAHWVSFAGVKAKIAAGVDTVTIFKGTRKHATMAMFGMEKSHTAENILEEFNKKVSQWLPPRKRMVGYVSTDNGANVVKAMKDGDYFRVPCLAHCINLVVQKFLAQEHAVHEILTICRRICTHFNHSFKARKELRRLQYQRRVPAKALIQEVVTRWNSTFYMLERLYEQNLVLHEYISFNLTGAALKEMSLQVEQWQLVKSLTDMLRPFEVFTREVSREDCNLGKAIPLLRMLQHQVKAVSSKLENDLEKQEAYDLAERLLMRLDDDERLVNIIAEEHYICATILDPRYKKALLSKTFIPFAESDVQQYIHWLARSASRFERERKLTVGEDSSSSEAAGHPASQKSTPGSVPVAEVSDFPSQPLTTPATVSSAEEPPIVCEADWLTMQGFSSPPTEKDTELHSRGGTMKDLESMVQAYLGDSTEVNISQDPLEYWHGKRKVWRELTNLAINYLSCPLASVSSERVFSAAGGIVTYKRTRLLPANVERLTMIKMNYDFLPGDYIVGECTQEEEATDQHEGGSSLLPDPPPYEFAEFEDELCFPDNE